MKKKAQMEYKCKNINLERAPLTTQGVFEGLCSKCATKDCTNHIETKEISLFGVNRKIRVMIQGKEPRIVIACEGYTS
jgi:hypothetical protein